MTKTLTPEWIGAAAAYLDASLALFGTGEVYFADFERVRTAIMEAAVADAVEHARRAALRAAEKAKTDPMIENVAKLCATSDAIRCDLGRMRPNGAAA